MHSKKGIKSKSKANAKEQLGKENINKENINKENINSSAAVMSCLQRSTLGSSPGPGSRGMSALLRDRTPTTPKITPELGEEQQGREHQPWGWQQQRQGEPPACSHWGLEKLL